MSLISFISGFRANCSWPMRVFSRTSVPRPLTWTAWKTSNSVFTPIIRRDCVSFVEQTFCGQHVPCRQCSVVPAGLLAGRPFLQSSSFYGFTCTGLAVKKEAYSCLISAHSHPPGVSPTLPSWESSWLVRPPACGHRGSQVDEVPGRSIKASRSRSAMKVPPVFTGGVAAAP